MSIVIDSRESKVSIMSEAAVASIERLPSIIPRSTPLESMSDGRIQRWNVEAYLRRSKPSATMLNLRYASEFPLIPYP